MRELRDEQPASDTGSEAKHAYETPRVESIQLTPEAAEALT
jgi:hypothetical protein